MVRPRPGSEVPLYVVDLVVKKMSAKSSRAPNTLAHQAREVPQPSQVPYEVPGLTEIVASARAVPVARALPRRVPPAAVSKVLRRIMASPLRCVSCSALSCPCHTCHQEASWGGGWVVE